MEHGWFFFTGAFQLNAQVSLHADTTSGCGSLEVAFSLVPPPASDTIDKILWDFGNGKTADGTLTPSALYKVPGTYDVSVTINGNRAISAENFITVYPSPIAGFYYSDTLGAGEFSFLFAETGGSDPSNNSTYAWSFGDDATALGRRVVHDYGSAGNYTVKLVAEDPAGCADSVSRQIQVNEFLKLPNVFTPNGDGLNDFFRIRTNGLNTYRLFCIFPFWDPGIPFRISLHCLGRAYFFRPGVA